MIHENNFLMQGADGDFLTKAPLVTPQSVGTIHGLPLHAGSYSIL
jgi:hypothetical protein